MGLAELYHYYNTEQADPRTNDWFLVGSPVSVALVIFSYLYFILGCGKRYMKNREPYSLKTFIRGYNVFQIVANTVITYMMLTSGYTISDLTLSCIPVNYSYDPLPYKMAKVMWYLYMVKVIDLIETVMFLLRKKDRQISFLHLYHHVSTLLIAWLTVKYIAGGMASFSMTLNCMVHVMMYTYYLLSSFNNSIIRQMCNTFKSYITTIQMGQFILIQLHSLQAFSPSCPIAKIAPTLMTVNMIANFYLFYNFYQRTYTKNKKIE